MHTTRPVRSRFSRPAVSREEASVSVGTAFHPRTAPLNRKMVWREWAGYFAAGVYADAHDIEYNAIREAAAADRRLSRCSSTRSRPRRRPPGRPGHHPRRHEDRRRPGHLHAVVRRRRQGPRRRHHRAPRRAGVPLDGGRPQLRWFALNAHGLDVQIEDVTEHVAALALQGPMSRRTCSRRRPARTGRDLPYFRRRATTVGGVAVDVTPHRLHRRPRLRAVGGRRRAPSPCGTR